MRKKFGSILLVLLALVSSVIWILELNSKYDFLPEKFSEAVDEFYYSLYNKDENAGEYGNYEYVLLSSISDVEVLEQIDLLVPDDTYIPSEDEISKTYSGLYSDSLIATRANYDIIIQDYDIEISDSMNLNDFRSQIVLGLQKNRPNVSFDISRSINKGDKEIPIIEFSTENETHIIYSFIAIIDANGELVTITLNSADPYINAVEFFETLINNMEIK